MDAARLIHRARTAAGLTQAELATRMNVHQPVIARLEAPGSNPTFATLARALDATGFALALSRVPAVADHDLGQLRERLAMTPAQRLRVFTAAHNNFARLVANASPR